MANIKVNDIKSASADNQFNNIELTGAELFSDSESFINDLEDNELQVSGGILLPPPAECCGCGDTAYRTMA